MTERYSDEDIDRLKKEVEVLVGRTIKSPKDFEYLSGQIFGYMKTNLSISTLKRLWGYVASTSHPSRFNLDLLSRMVGYSDWSAFLNRQEGEASSRFFMKSKLVADALQVDDKVRLTWQPSRIVALKYLGNNVFVVEESIKSKLAKGDTFTCQQFVDSEPLYLFNLKHSGMDVCNYVAGKNGGIKWNVVRE